MVKLAFIVFVTGTVLIVLYLVVTSIFFVRTCYTFVTEFDTRPHGLAEDHLRLSHPRFAPVWSPDGKHIVFSLERTISTEYTPGIHIYVFASDGSKLTRISKNDRRYVIDHSPAVSPDGSRIAYASYNGIIAATPDTTDATDTAFYEIEISDFEGDTRRRITEKVGLDVAPAWTPDGSQIAFIRHDEYDRCSNTPMRNGAYTVAVDSESVRKLTPIEEELSVWSLEPYEASMEWSPDRKSLALMFQEVVPKSDESSARTAYVRSALVTLNAEEPGVVRLLSGTEMELGAASEFVNHPAWSPSGDRIAFMKVDTENSQKLFTIGRDGSGLREVADRMVDSRGSGLNEGTVSWSPDAAQILFSIGNKLHVVNANGSGLYTLGEGRYASWSPDGSRIAYVRTDSRQGIVLYTTAPDGSNTHVLVVRGHDGFVKAFGPDLTISATVSSCSTGIVVPRPEANPGLVKDCEALVRMLKQEYAEGLNWEARTPIEEWAGVALDYPFDGEGSPGSEEQSSELRVRGLSLPSRGLDNVHSTFYSELATLVELRVLDLSGNQLRGDIPPILSELTKLEKLDLSDNELSGPIPPQLGDLANLEELDLGSNALTGNIPSEFGNLKRLTALNLGSNDLSG